MEKTFNLDNDCHHFPTFFTGLFEILLKRTSSPLRPFPGKNRKTFARAERRRGWTRGETEPE